MANAAIPRRLTTWPATLLKNLLLAIAYVSLGRASLLLAIPPGYAMAIYPPAGIALALVLIGGYRLAPGVGLGSLFLNLWIGWETQHGFNETASILAVLIAVGAMAQASCGAWLWRRLIAYPCGLDTNADIVKFVLLCAPVGCLVGATVGISSLYGLGILPASAVAGNWATWWIGDTLGVLVLTPVCLILLGEPRDIWRSRRINVMVPQILTLASVIVAFVLVRGWEQQRQAQEFHSEVQSVARAVQKQLNFFIESQKRVSDIFSNFDSVSRQQYGFFATDFVENHPALMALEWLPRIKRDARMAYEQRMQAEGFLHYTILQFDLEHKKTAVDLHDDYFPIHFLVPQTGNEDLIGVDLGSEPQRLALIQRARDTRSPVASAPMGLLQDTAEHASCLLFTAAYDNTRPLASLEQRRQAFLGVVASALDMGKLLASVLHEKENSDILMRFVDGGQASAATVYYDTLAQGANSDPVALHTHIDHIDFAGRELSLLASPSPAYLAKHKSWAAWATLIGGMLFCGLLGTYFLLVSARSYNFEALVRKRTGELHHSERRVQAILNNAADGILSVNVEKNIELANLAAGKLLGYDPKDLQGKELASLFADGASAVFFDEHISDSQPIETQVFKEVNGLRSDGVLIPLELAIASLHSEGQFLFIVMLHDLTERRRVDSMKGEFVSTVSHELRTPLTSIRGSLGLLLGGALGEMSGAAVKLVKMANDNAERLHALINDILDFEKLEHGGIEFKLERQLLPDLIDKAVQFNLGYAEKFSVTLVVNPADVEQAYADVDESRLIQVLSNLISNAVKFSRPQQTVEIGLERRKDVARIWVRDQGVGIADEFRSRIFSKFSQADAADGRKYPGTGLGLSLSKAMIEKMGGSIGFDSIAGQGATFYVDLPVAGDELVEGADQEEKKEENQGALTRRVGDR